MADVDIIQNTTIELKKSRKVKKTTKKRESIDQGSETVITEIEQTEINGDTGYVD